MSDSDDDDASVTLPADFNPLNLFAVGSGEGLVVHSLAAWRPRTGGRVTRAEALNLIAWMATLCEPALTPEEIAEARRAVEVT